MIDERRTSLSGCISTLKHESDEHRLLAWLTGIASATHLVVDRLSQ